MRNLSTATVFAALSLAAAAHGAQLLDFKTNAISPAAPEFALINGLLVTAPGSNHLVIEVPFVVPGLIPGSHITPANTTVFDNVTMVISPSPLIGLAATTPLGGGLALVSSTVATRDVAFYANGANPILLLRATTLDSVLSGLQGFNTANIQTPTLTYDGTGAIGSIIGVTDGSASYSLNDVAPAYGANADHHILNFDANATGLFSYTPVPEPTSMTVVAGGLLALVARRKRA